MPNLAKLFRKSHHDLSGIEYKCCLIK